HCRFLSWRFCPLFSFSRSLLVSLRLKCDDCLHGQIGDVKRHGVAVSRRGRRRPGVREPAGPGHRGRGWPLVAPAARVVRAQVAQDEDLDHGANCNVCESGLVQVHWLLSFRGTTKKSTTPITIQASSGMPKRPNTAAFDRLGSASALYWSLALRRTLTRSA